MPLGSLPIKYLGLPLMSRKLSSTDCTPLLEKLKARVNSWIASKLSYGGRLQLINSVLVTIGTGQLHSSYLEEPLEKSKEFLDLFFVEAKGKQKLSGQIYVCLKRLGVRTTKLDTG